MENAGVWDVFIELCHCGIVNFNYYAYISPHFYVLGYGWLIPSPEVIKETGWVYKNKDAHPSNSKNQSDWRSIFGTSFYALKHAGLCSIFHKWQT
jgi:hypothetical protein